MEIQIKIMLHVNIYHINNMKEQKERGIVNHIKEYWIIYAFAGQLIMNYTVTNQTLKDHTKRIEKLETKAESTDIVVTEIRTKLSSIETSILYIKEAVKK